MLWSGNMPCGCKFGPMRIFHDRLNVLRAGGAGFEMMRAFAHAPAVIAAFDDEIDFLPQILADVAAPTGRRSARSKL